VLFRRIVFENLNAMMAMLMMHMVVGNMTLATSVLLFRNFGQCILYVSMYLCMCVCLSACVFFLFTLSLSPSLSLSLSLSHTLCIYIYLYIFSFMHIFRARLLNLSSFVGVCIATYATEKDINQTKGRFMHEALFLN
jgi:hypothetical protein